jgi:hypothetical protein
LASEVDICNLALSFLGDDASVSSIDPPEGSAQAEHCSRFYPIARDGLLNLHPWNFASKRTLLAQVTNPYTQWRYAYALPADYMQTVSIIPSDAADDYAVAHWPTDRPEWMHNYSPVLAAGQYVPQRYSIEIDSVGNNVLYTNIDNALLRYQARVTDTMKFPPLFTHALAWHLASMLAGPVMKGDSGAKMAQSAIQQMATYLQQARVADGMQRASNVEHIVGWMSGR